MSQLSLKYTVSNDDLVAFNEEYFFNSETIRRRFQKERAVVLGTFIFAGLAFALLAINEDSASKSNYWAGLFIFFLCLVPGLLIFALIPRTTLKSIRANANSIYASGKNLTLVGQQELLLSPDSAVVRNEFYEAKYNWQVIEKMEETNDYIFLYVSSVSALIIPKRAINEGSWQDAVKYLAEKVQG